MRPLEEFEQEIQDLVTDKEVRIKISIFDEKRLRCPIHIHNINTIIVWKFVFI